MISNCFIKQRQPSGIFLRQHWLWGGALSGEHGIGSAKAPYLHQALSRETRGAMKSIKAALDPSGIMNPGKIFED
ncbi:MAG: FAD-linked oxidase C-terminal domain-containing protein [Thermoleophilia bacterium]